MEKIWFLQLSDSRRRYVFFCVCKPSASGVGTLYTQDASRCCCNRESFCCQAVKCSWDGGSGIEELYSSVRGGSWDKGRKARSMESTCISVEFTWLLPQCENQGIDFTIVESLRTVVTLPALFPTRSVSFRDNERYRVSKTYHALVGSTGHGRNGLCL